MRVSDDQSMPSDVAQAWMQALKEELARTVYCGVEVGDTLEVVRNKLQAIIDWHVSLALHEDRARRGALSGEWI